MDKESREELAANTRPFHLPNKHNKVIATATGITTLNSHPINTLSVPVA
jgi:hypothetical protein